MSGETAAIDALAMSGGRARRLETPANTLADAWAVQCRVIGALLMREVLTRYGRHNIGILWLFIEPMMFTVGVTALWTVTRSAHGTSLPITAFALTGYSSVLLWRNMPARCISALEPNRSLLYHRNVRVFDVIVARLLLECGGTTISFILLGLLFMTAGLLDPPEDLLTVTAGWLMLAWFGMALGLLLGALSIEYELVEKLWHPISYLTLPLSGAAYIVDALPDSVQPLALYVPMVDGIELLRQGYFGSHAKAHYDIGYMAAVTLVLTALGLVQLRRAAAKVLVE